MERLGWWVAKPGPDGHVQLGHGDGRAVLIGEALVVEPPVEPCKRGLHASISPLDALRYASGEVVFFRVRLSGVVVEAEGKMAASERTALWSAGGREILEAFVRSAARRALEREKSVGRDQDPIFLEIAEASVDGLKERARLAARVAEEAARSGDPGRIAAMRSARLTLLVLAEPVAETALAASEEAAMAAAWDAVAKGEPWREAFMAEKERQEQDLTELLHEAGTPV